MGGEAAVRRDKVWGRVMWGENGRHAVRERCERAVRPACVFAFSDHESKARPKSSLVLPWRRSTEWGQNEGAMAPDPRRNRLLPDAHRRARA